MNTNGTSIVMARFLTIAQAARETGLSQYSIRKGCLAGIIPHIRTGGGGKILVNVPAMLEQLDAQSREAVTQ